MGGLHRLVPWLLCFQLAVIVKRLLSTDSKPTVLTSTVAKVDQLYAVRQQIAT